MELWTAVTIGFFGSFHCIGMCGPIAMALPNQSNTLAGKIAGRSLYNLGRIITYSAMGLIFGVIGHSISLAGLQRPLSVLLGVLIIAAVLLPKVFYQRLRSFTGFERLLTRLNNRLRQAMQSHSKITLLSIGLLNGLLPCGFVYAGLAGAITTGTVTGSTLYMALFGMGTFPAMFMMSMAPDLISLETRRRINRLMPYLAIALGILLIIRGLLMGGALSVSAH